MFQHMGFWEGGQRKEGPTQASQDSRWDHNDLVTQGEVGSCLPHFYP